MMKISPVCWVFGHSVRVHLTVDVVKGDASRVHLCCARCEEEIPDRIERLTFNYPRPERELILPSQSRGLRGRPA